MADKIILVSDDTDFFEYLRSKLVLRKNDEIFFFSFDSILEKFAFINDALIILNSENAKDKTLDFLKIGIDAPTIVTAYNDDSDFKKKCYGNGAFDYITILISDEDLKARLTPALGVCSIIKKNKKYRDILVENGVIANKNEVFINYSAILDGELAKIDKTKQKAVFVAISPNEKEKYLIQSNTLETVILSEIRRNDMLMNYAPNKYFMLLYDIDVKNVEKILENIVNKLPQKIYFGIVNITNQKRQQIINESLNKLHLSMNSMKFMHKEKEDIVTQETTSKEIFSNFKKFRQEFEGRLNKIIPPAFYRIQQKYQNSFMGLTIQHDAGNGYGTFYIKCKNSVSSFKVSSAGFSKINVDITCQKNNQEIDSKRISFEPEEFEQGILEDLLEQFINEYKEGESNGNS